MGTDAVVHIELQCVVNLIVCPSVLVQQKIWSKANQEAEGFATFAQGETGPKPTYSVTSPVGVIVEDAVIVSSFGVQTEGDEVLW